MPTSLLAGVKLMMPPLVMLNSVELSPNVSVSGVGRFRSSSETFALRL